MADGTSRPDFCRCREMTGGVCLSCARQFPMFPVGSEPVPTVTIKITEVDGLVPMVQRKLASLLREFAEREAGPVRERLRQVADAFEVA